METKIEQPIKINYLSQKKKKKNHKLFNTAVKL